MTDRPVYNLLNNDRKKNAECVLARCCKWSQIILAVIILLISVPLTVNMQQ